MTLCERMYVTNKFHVVKKNLAFLNVIFLASLDLLSKVDRFIMIIYLLTTGLTA